MITRDCSWCGCRNIIASGGVALKPLCLLCNHRGDVPKSHCDCPACRRAAEEVDARRSSERDDTPSDLRAVLADLVACVGVTFQNRCVIERPDAFRAAHRRAVDLLRATTPVADSPVVLVAQPKEFTT